MLEALSGFGNGFGSTELELGAVVTLTGAASAVAFRVVPALSRTLFS